MDFLGEQSPLRIATVVATTAAVAWGLSLLRNNKQQSLTNDKIVEVPSSIPFLGFGLEYFSGPFHSHAVS